jgi:hypothetical protein
MVPALAALGAFGYYVYPVLFEFMGRTPALFLVILAGMALYFGVGILTGSEAAVKVTGVLSRRLKRKRA